MGAEAAVVMMQGKQLAAMPPEQRPVAKKMFVDFYNANMTSPYVAAERGYLDAVIEPQDTRVRLRQAMRQLRDKNVLEPVKKHNIAPCSHLCWLRWCWAYFWLDATSCLPLNRSKGVGGAWHRCDWSGCWG